MFLPFFKNFVGNYDVTYDDKFVLVILLNSFAISIKEMCVSKKLSIGINPILLKFFKFL